MFLERFWDRYDSLRKEPVQKWYAYIKDYTILSTSGKKQLENRKQGHMVLNLAVINKKFQVSNNILHLKPTICLVFETNLKSLPVAVKLKTFSFSHDIFQEKLKEQRGNWGTTPGFFLGCAEYVNFLAVVNTMTGVKGTVDGELNWCNARW